jgi:hypothetical protein
MTDAPIRPLLFVRFRLYRGGQAEWVRDVLRDEQANLYDDLAKLRAKNLPEDHPEIADVREKLSWSINALRDIDHGLIDLVGPDRDPRPRD